MRLSSSAATPDERCWHLPDNGQHQLETPLLDAVLRYWREGVIRFHMPGHRGGPGANLRLRQTLGEAVFRMDVTGVLGLDDLHQPRSVIAEAERLAAEAFGADRSYFLVNGTTAGVQAMILSTCRPGDKLIVARNVHKSILSGLILAGAQPIFVPPEVDSRTGIALGVTPERLRQAMDRHPDARAVLLVSPTYHGVTSDIERIAALAHARGMLLLVDEAHGPHFIFHERFPTSALAAGADACAQGMHKMLGAFTQASILHLRGDGIDPDRVEAALRLLQSTSGSYLLMASIDVARMQMVTAGRQLLEQALQLSERLRREVNQLEPLYAFGEEWIGRPGVAGLDPTKVTVTVRGLGMTGQQMERCLRDIGPIQVEMPDLFNVLFIVGFGNRPEEIERLVSAFRQVRAQPERWSGGGAGADGAAQGGPALLEQAALVLSRPMDPPELAELPRTAFFAPSRPVPLEASVGHVSAEIITCYPPGIPILCPGERVTSEIVKHLEVVRAAGLAISGPRDPSLATIQVL